MPKKYEHIEILEETLEIPSKIKITYEDGSIEEVDNAYDCNMHFKAFAKQIGLENIENLLGDESKIIYLNREKSDTVVSEEKVTEKPVETKKEDTAKETATKSEKKKSRFNIKRIGAWCLAILAGGGIAYGAYKLGQRNNGTRTFIQMVDTSEYDNLSYEEKLVLLTENNEEVIEGLVDMANGNFKTSADLDQCIENIANKYLANVTQIANFIKGNMSSPSGNKEIINLGEAFKENPLDFCAVDYFEGLRDNVVSSAYDKKSVNETKTSVEKFNKEFVEFVFGGKILPCKINGQTVYYTFESLSPSAKMTVLTMGMMMLNIEHDFSITIDDVEYNRITTITKVYELNTTVYNELMNTQKFTKTK